MARPSFARVLKEDPGFRFFPMAEKPRIEAPDRA